MTFDDIHPAVRGAYAAHQRLRRPGFPAEDLFTGVQRVLGLDLVRVSVVRGGVTLFVIDVGRTDLSPEAYSAAWTVLVEAIQDRQVITQATLDRMYADWPYSDTGLVVALTAKGLLP